MKFFRVTLALKSDRQDAEHSKYYGVCPFTTFDVKISMSFPIAKHVPIGIIDDIDSLVDSGHFRVSAPTCCLCYCKNHDLVLDVTIAQISVSDDSETTITYTIHRDDEDKDDNYDENENENENENEKNENDGVDEDDDEDDDEDENVLNAIKNAIPIATLKNGISIKYNSHWNCYCKKEDYTICGCGCDKKHDGWASANDAGMISAIK